MDNILHTMRARYLKGEPLMRPSDSFDFHETITAMTTLHDEFKEKNMTTPIPVGTVE